MKNRVLSFCLFISMLLSAGYGALAQTVIGTYKVYVSKQGGNPYVLNSGNATRMADEGRVVDITSFNISGPIQVSPQHLSVSGPPCPTYTATGRRIPENPAPPVAVSGTGTVTLDTNNIPSPGSMAHAGFSVKDNGYWTTCSSGDKHYYDSTYEIQYDIYSILIGLDTNEIDICNGGSYDALVTKLYPGNNIGSVQWRSLYGHCSVSGGPSGATITRNSEGPDVIVADYQVGAVHYSAFLAAKDCKLKFSKSEVTVLWYDGGTYDAASNLTADSDKKGGEWSINGTAKIDKATGKVTFPKGPGGPFTVTVKKPKIKNCEASFKLYIAGFRVNVGNAKVCDGAEVPITVSVYPSGADESVLKSISITLNSKPNEKWMGNPANKKDLEFDPNPVKDLKSKVKNAYWYANQADLCNDLSSYTISATAKVSGKDVTAVAGGKDQLSVDASSACVNGNFSLSTKDLLNVKIKPAFANLPGNKVQCTLTDGGTTKTIKGTVNNKCLPNSQYYDMVQKEEEYHLEQLKDPKNNCTKNLFDIAKMFANAKPGVGTDQATAKADAIKNLQASIKAIVTADQAALQNTKDPSSARCCMEQEAKAKLKATYKAALKCAYPKCVP